MGKNKNSFKIKGTIFHPGDSSVGWDSMEIGINLDLYENEEDRQQLRGQFAEIGQLLLGEDKNQMVVFFSDEDKDLIQSHYRRTKFKNK